MNIREITMVGLGAALMVVFTHLSIPVPPVPLTLQLFGVVLLGILFNRKIATLSVLTFVLIGAIGVPVFAGFKGGLSSIVGPTGGYLYAFVISVFVVATFAQKNKMLHMFIGAYLALAISYVVGTIQLKFVLGMDWTAAITAGTGAGVFLIKDLILVGVAVVVGQKIKIILNKNLLAHK